MHRGKENDQKEVEVPWCREEKRFTISMCERKGEKGMERIERRGVGWNRTNIVTVWYEKKRESVRRFTFIVTYKDRQRESKSSELVCLFRREEVCRRETKSSYRIFVCDKVND